MNNWWKELYETDRKKYNAYMSCIVVGIFSFAAIIGVLVYYFANTTPCEHEYIITEEIAPTYTEKGKVVRECNLCGAEKTETIPKLTAPSYVEGVEYEEIYRAYKENELRAKDVYKNNRYRITADVYGIEADSVLNLTGGAILTMLIEIDDDNVFFLAEFDRDQEEALKQINVGDTITFEGKCSTEKYWINCELIKQD